jgi:hypothetical protein
MKDALILSVLTGMFSYPLEFLLFRDFMILFTSAVEV